MAYCLIDQLVLMETIVVQAAGTPYPRSRTDVTTAGTTQSVAGLAAGAASVLAFPFVAGGAHLVAGIAPGLATAATSRKPTVLRSLDVAMLSDTNVTIAAGTGVTWTNQSSNEPHHIVIPAEGATLREASLREGGPAGPATYDGSRQRNLFADQNYTLIFSKPAVYTYY